MQKQNHLRTVEVFITGPNSFLVFTDNLYNLPLSVKFAGVLFDPDLGDSSTDEFKEQEQEMTTQVSRIGCSVVCSIIHYLQYACVINGFDYLPVALELFSVTVIIFRRNATGCISPYAIDMCV